MIRPRNIKELEAQREELISGSWLKMSSVKRAELIRDFSAAYVVPPLSLHMPTAYRAQRNEGEYLFTSVDRLLAPPAECVTKAGRLNRSGNPTLYLGSTSITAVFETPPPLGALVTVLACQMRADAEPIEVAPIAFARAKSTRLLGPFDPSIVTGALGCPRFKEELVRRELLDQWLIQDSTISELLTLQPLPDSEQELYELTNGIREHIYSTYPYYQGIQYPSIVVGLTSFNCALDADRWNDIEPVEVWVVRVVDDLYEHPDGSAILYTSSLHKIGYIESDRSISYHDTTRSFIEATHDFKQSRKFTPMASYIRPSLQKPFLRYRVSYGSRADRKRFDFLLT